MTLSYLVSNRDREIYQTAVKEVEEIFPGSEGWEDQPIEAGRGNIYVPFHTLTKRDVELLLTAFPQKESTFFQSYDGTPLAYAVYGSSTGRETRVEVRWHIYILPQNVDVNFDVEYNPQDIYPPESFQTN